VDPRHTPVSTRNTGLVDHLSDAHYHYFGGFKVNCVVSMLI
jgi:hypothetical protein